MYFTILVYFLVHFLICFYTDFTKEIIYPITLNRNYKKTLVPTSFVII